MATRVYQNRPNIFKGRSTMGNSGGLKQWLEERCQTEHLSLRQAGAKAGLSHATIADIINGARPSADTIKKLAGAFGGNGQLQRIAVEDELLVLSGYRSERPDGEMSEPVARLLDKLTHFSEAQLKVMEHFADFISSEKGER